MDGGGRPAAVRLRGKWTEDERELLIICEKELLASTWGLVAFAPWLQRTVVSWTDNTVAMATMRSMAPRSEVMQAITARRTEYLFHVEKSWRSRGVSRRRRTYEPTWARGGRWRQLCGKRQRAGCRGRERWR